MLENGKLATLNIRDILPNRFQPRIHFDEVKLNELAESIRKYGLIQPIVVRQIGTKYEIVAGERRYKASTLANKETIPAIIVTLSDRDSEEIALLENIQREDLTPIEEAVSYKKILDVGYISQEELAKKIGKSQVGIVNKIRLLSLDDAVQDALLHGRISERHARSLLKIHNNDKQVEMLNRIINERLTVKMTDREIKMMLASDDVPKEKVIETLSTSDKPVRRAIPVASHRIIKVNPPKELMDKINKKKEERVDTMDIDKILEEAQDITPNEEVKPAADMASLMQQNPNTVTSPLITNDKPVVPVSEPAIEPGKFVTPSISNEVPTTNEGVQTSNVSFDNVFNQNLGGLNNESDGQQVSNDINNSVPLNNTIDNIAPIVDNMNNVQTTPINNDGVVNNSVVSDVTIPNSIAEQSPMQEMPNNMGNVNPMPINDPMVTGASVMNDTAAMPSVHNNTVDSLATEVAPEVANDNLTNIAWPNTTTSEPINTIDDMATPVVPTPENPTLSTPAETNQPNLSETAIFNQNTMNNQVAMPNMMAESAPMSTTESASTVEPIQSMAVPTDTPQIPILPGIPGATIEDVNQSTNMSIPDDNILEVNTPNVQTPEQINNTLDNSAQFRQVINLIRNCASEIEKLGFYIDADEIDLGEKYQVTFKIDKG